MEQVVKRTIEERKVHLDGRTDTWTCEVLSLEPGRRAVLRYVIDRERRIGGTDLVLPSGTVTIAHYWSDRPFNVYHWIHDGRTLAYYVNVSETSTVSEVLVEYLDLELDVVVRPSGALEVLDEDDVPDDIDPRHRRTIADALERLVTGSRPLIAEIERESAPFR